MSQKKFNNEKEEALLKELRSNGETVYSFSRLSTYHTCQYEYYKTYIERKKGIGNCYSEIGNFIHDYIEKVYRNTIEDTENFQEKFKTKMAELEILDMDFPNEVIKNSFSKDMKHFTANFKKMDGDFTTEKMFVVEIDGHYLMGYIDAVRHISNETHIIDWKTSSKFTSGKLLKAGRQLVLYKMALESLHDIKIDKTMWNMLKYVYVCWELKNKTIKKKMVNRGKIMKEMDTTFQKELKAAGMNDVEIFLALETARQTNSFSDLPALIQEKFWLEDCLLVYEVNEEVEQELRQYISSTIQEIESKNEKDANAWPPLNMQTDSFYCNTLCNHRETCPFIKEYNKKHMNK